jgi:signal recognition particle subunit SRP54
VREAVGKPIKFISTGEKLDNLETFYPDRMASRILGMGDVLSLVEKAQKNIDEKDAERAVMDMFQNDFSFEQFVNMQSMMKKMGNMGDIMKMMGVGGMLGLSSEDQNKIATEGEAMMNKYEIAINSMTIAERRKPDLIDFPRRRRIARGSGLKENEIGKMLNEFEKMREAMRQMKAMMGGMGPLGGMFGGGNPFGGGGGGNPFGGGGGPFGGLGGGKMPPMPPGFKMPPGMGGMPGSPSRPGFQSPYGLKKKKKKK